MPQAEPMRCLVGDDQRDHGPAAEPCYALAGTNQSAQRDSDRALSALLALNVCPPARDPPKVLTYRPAQIVLSDIVVLLRGCVLWPGSRCVRSVSVFLLVATTGTRPASLMAS